MASYLGRRKKDCIRIYLKRKHGFPSIPSTLYIFTIFIKAFTIFLPTVKKKKSLSSNYNAQRKNTILFMPPICSTVPHT